MMSTTVNGEFSMSSTVDSVNSSLRKASMLKRMSSKSRKLHENQQRPVSNYDVISKALSKDEIVAPPAYLKKSSSYRFFKSQAKGPLRRRTSSVTTVMSEASEGLDSSNSGTAVSVAENVVQWMEFNCPEDVLPKILSFAGPQIVAALSKTNKKWNSIVRKEAIWHVMCEEMYKWKKGEPEPKSWFDLYRFSPCVPVDYSSVQKALSVALNQKNQPTSLRRQSEQPSVEQVRSIRVLLRPGKYYLKNCIEIRAAENVEVALQTMEMPSNVFASPRPITIERPALELPLQRRKKGQRALRHLLSCVRPQVVEEPTETEELSQAPEEWVDEASMPKQAILILRSKRPNEPVFRVQRGSLRLTDVEIQHVSHGTDIWNGNAAVQIQPPLSDDDTPIVVSPRPSATLQHVQITSRSGRGIVNIDGGNVSINSCFVRDCAATGIYIGGHGSTATLTRSDVMRNGIGNPARRGIARGHSGIYLEQGLLQIQDCNISDNVLTGISVVSPENSIIEMRDSDLVANGTYQLELPPPGTASRQRSVTNNNNMSTRGRPRLRSGLTDDIFSSSTASTPLG